MKIEKCPFCGGEATVVKTESCGRYIGCWDCGGRTEEFETDYAGSAHDKAIAAWNRRAQPDDIVDANKMADNEPLACEGCENQGKYEAEKEYGYPSPCTCCKRATSDNYRRKPGRNTCTCGGNVIDWMTGNNPATFEKWLRCTACGKLRKPEGGAG